MLKTKGIKAVPAVLLNEASSLCSIKAWSDVPHKETVSDLSVDINSW